MNEDVIIFENHTKCPVFKVKYLQIGALKPSRDTKTIQALCVLMHYKKNMINSKNNKNIIKSNIYG